MPGSLRLGIDLGGTTAKLGIVDQDNRIIHRAAIPTADAFNQAVRDMADAAKTLAQDAGVPMAHFPYAGIGVPSMINPKTGRMVFANNTGWENAPIREALKAHLGIPVLAANDADCALAGEAAAGAARGMRNVLMLTLGTGVGSALLIEQRLYTGGDSMGMEMGHLPLIAGGWPCTCGTRGCLEAYVSTTGLIRLTEETMAAHPDSAMHAHIQMEGGKVTGRTAFACAEQGDAAALSVVDTYCAWLAQGIGGLVSVCRPELVILGGGISRAGEPLFARVRAMAEQFVFAHHLIGAPAIVPAQLGNDAGIVGAANLGQTLGQQSLY